MTLAYRDAGDADRAFVIDSWSESFRCAHAAGLIAMSDWREIMPRQLERILARPCCTVTVACNPEESDTRLDLMGWIAVERGYSVPTRVRDARGRWADELLPTDAPLVHYVFVKQPYRRLGVARGLFAAARVDPAAEFAYTTKTAAAQKLAAKVPRARWNPLIARFDAKP